MAAQMDGEQVSPNNFPMVAMIPQAYNETIALDSLRMVNKLYIKQIPALSEILCGIPAEAKFDIFNERKERLFHAVETSEFCERFCCTTTRGCTLSIFNNINQEIIRINRPFKCCSGCCWCANKQCCSQEVSVESPPGTVIGTVSQIGSSCRYTYQIKDVTDTVAFTLVGPVLVFDGPYSCCCENKFTIFGTDGVTEIGAIHKKYRGFLSEAFSSADAFSLKFPMDLNVKMKALTLGALFLIDFMLFSFVPNNN